MATTRKYAKQVIGSCIRVLRQQAGLTLEQLARRADLSYQYLSGIETGKENFSINVVERIADALGFALNALIDAAYQAEDPFHAPRVESRNLRPGVPLPEGLSVAALETVINQAHLMLFRINRGVHAVVGQPLHAVLATPHLQAVTTDLFAAAVAGSTPFQSTGSNDDHFLAAPGRGGRALRLEVEARALGEFRCESLHGSDCWHIAPRYQVDARGNLSFVHVMLAQLAGAESAADADWRRAVDAATRLGKPVFEASPAAITKLLDGTVLLTTPPPAQWKQFEHRRAGEAPPPWSIFARGSA